MRDRGVKKPLKTTDQLISKIYSDIVGAWRKIQRRVRKSCQILKSSI